MGKMGGIKIQIHSQQGKQDLKLDTQLDQFWAIESDIKNILMANSDNIERNKN